MVLCEKAIIINEKENNKKSGDRQILTPPYFIFQYADAAYFANFTEEQLPMASVTVAM